MKFIFMILFSFFIITGIFAQDASILEMSGTVEIKSPGSNIWESAFLGQAVSAGTIISTGFRSYANIKIGNSVINVRPLTRLSLSDIIASQNMETVNVGLQTGRVRVDVSPPSGTRSSVTIQTPLATSSVRGTVFEVDVFSIQVIEGSIIFNGTSGSPVIVDAGGFSNVDERTGRVAFNKNMLLSSLSPVQPIAFDSFNSFPGAAHQKSGIEVGGEMEFD